MRKRVAIVGMISPYAGDTSDTDVWCINRAFVAQAKASRVDRLFVFDDLALFGDGFVAGVNALPPACEVIARKHWPEIPRSQPYPLEWIVRSYGLASPYFECTSAYMIALAVRLGYERITLHGMYHVHDSLEYMHHKACLDFWVGVAVGRGIEVVGEDTTALARPFLWSSPLYGYVRNAYGMAANTIQQGCYVAAGSLPVEFIDNDRQPMTAEERTAHLSGIARLIDNAKAMFRSRRAGACP